jgi:flagellar biosynthesis protein FlhG
MANVDVLLDFHTPVNLMNVLAGECHLNEIIFTGPNGLMIVPAASGNKQLAELGPLECAGLVRAFSELDQDINTLVIDTATGISESVASLCAASSSVLVVVNNEPTSIRDSVALIKLLNVRNSTARIHILANMVQGAKEGNGIFQRILESMDHTQNAIISYAGYIPYDDAVRKAVASHRAVVTAFPHSRSALALTELGKQVRRWPVPCYPHGQLEFFVERLLQQNNVEMEVLS